MITPRCPCRHCPAPESSRSQLSAPHVGWLLFSRLLCVAGAPSDACFKTEFEKGEQYLTYLRVHDDDHSGRFLTPAYPHNPSTYKDELYIMCDINITYPLGMS